MILCMRPLSVLLLHMWILPHTYVTEIPSPTDGVVRPNYPQKGKVNIPGLRVSIDATLGDTVPVVPLSPWGGAFTLNGVCVAK